jgi:uncharacterized protein
MSAETDLSNLLQNMRPERNPGEYVFCSVESYEQAMDLRPVAMFQEKEGITVILPREQADTVSLSYSLACAWITLTVHSSLEAVGLTAAVSQALAEENISCNVVAAYYHDHLFVPLADVERAMEALIALTRQFPS